MGEPRRRSRAAPTRRQGTRAGERHMRKENHLERHTQRDTVPQGDRHPRTGVLHGHPPSGRLRPPQGPLGRGSPACWPSLPCVHPGEPHVLSPTQECSECRPPTPESAACAAPACVFLVTRNSRPTQKATYKKKPLQSAQTLGTLNPRTPGRSAVAPELGCPESAAQERPSIRTLQCDTAGPHCSHHSKL